jgi:hypothetical protein
MLLKCFAIALTVLLLHTPTLNAEESCKTPREVAPGRYTNTPRAWGMDSGVIVRGFLDLRDHIGVHDVTHGVDISHHNEVDYDNLHKCGAKFAVVKMDTMFKSHSEALQNRGITVVPYAYLGVPKQFRYWPERLSSDHEMNKLSTIFVERGKKEAAIFIERAREALGKKLSYLPGMDKPVFVLDIEETLDTSTRSAAEWRKNNNLPVIAETSIKADQRVRYAKLYSSMVVSWINKVQESFPETVVVFYTFPDMYSSYLIHANTEDYKRISSLPIWLANTRADGGEPAWVECTTLDDNCKGVQRMCQSAAGGNKCILHQYTHRGLFGVRQKNSDVPPHLDLDRLFPVNVLTTSAGIKQYVRDMKYR